MSVSVGSLVSCIERVKMEMSVLKWGGDRKGCLQFPPSPSLPRPTLHQPYIYDWCEILRGCPSCICAMRLSANFVRACVKDLMWLSFKEIKNHRDLSCFGFCLQKASFKIHQLLTPLTLVAMLHVSLRWHCSSSFSRPLLPCIFSVASTF